ncbi:hypothetical protein [Arthrobacter sp. B3I4]|uniref:hypothetical protein n=1 Tax=Arthrobacter sp. B3I4 TaxID=3042267 RepID=UPI00277D9711|nr:hypothetical protein [Arthrobacter sp. B3I4]MDQ0756059.1 hypothetical protein [Arthrobacter sp. B3I4]
MPLAFTLNSVTYGCLTPDPGEPGTTHTWEYGKQPKVVATLALVGGGTLDVYARAERWTQSHILVRWEDDDYRPRHAWLPSDSVRRVTASEWDIWEYHRCPANLRHVRWGDRLPGFLPA